LTLHRKPEIRSIQERKILKGWHYWHWWHYWHKKSGTTWRYERGFGAPDVCNGVGSHWVENINWMRVASDLEIKTTGQIPLQGD